MQRAREDRLVTYFTLFLGEIRKEYVGWLVKQVNFTVNTTIEDLMLVYGPELHHVLTDAFNQPVSEENGEYNTLTRRIHRLQIVTKEEELAKDTELCSIWIRSNTLATFSPSETKDDYMAAAILAQAMLRKFKITDKSYSLTWFQRKETSNDGGVGGAMFITHDDITECNPLDWLQKQESHFNLQLKMAFKE